MMRARPFLESLSHPASIAAVALLLLNDHVLKSAWPSWTTGKLSDVAGLAFFPLLLAAVAERFPPVKRLTNRQVLAICVGATAAVFTAVELIPVAANTYSEIMGALQWPLRRALDATAEPMGVMVTSDPSDLLTLPALAIAWRIGATTLGNTSPNRRNPTRPASSPPRSQQCSRAHLLGAMDQHPA
jgi:hypothetical protein